jgi:hypothetical protein
MVSLLFVKEANQTRKNQRPLQKLGGGGKEKGLISPWL